MGRSLTAAAVAVLVAGCNGVEPGEPWDRDEMADTDASVDGFEVVPLDDDPSDDGDAQSPSDSSPRGCDPDRWSSGWTSVADGPVLEAHMAWEAVGLRPSQIVEHGGRRQAWYVGQALEHCSVGGWAATCLVGRVGQADAPIEDLSEPWSFAHDGPSMDLWHWGLSVRRLFVVSPTTSSAGRWDAWLALEGIEVDSKIYWATSDDGDRWTVRLSEPALGPAYGSWDAAGVSDPAVWTRHGASSMLYTGFSGEFDRPQIGLAQLTDQGWVRADTEPVLSHGKPNRHDSWGVLRPSVLSFDDCVLMFHQAIDETGNSTLAVATSTDGRSWARADQSLSAASGLPSWHDAGEYDPVVYADGDDVYLLYHGASGSNGGGVGWITLP